MKSSPINPALKDVWGVTRVIYICQGIMQGVFLVPFNAFLYEDLGANPTALRLVVLSLVFSYVASLASEIPTGVIADHIGRRRAVLTFFAIGTCAFSLALFVPFVESVTISFLLAAGMAVLYQIGFSFFSGSFAAWVVDTTQERNIKEGYGIIMSRMYGHMLLAQIAALAIALYLYLIHQMFYAILLGVLAYVFEGIYCTFKMKETRSLEFYSGKLLVKESVARMKKILSVGFHMAMGTPPLFYLTLMYSSFMLLVHLIDSLWPIAMRANFGAAKMSFYWYVAAFGTVGVSFLGSKLIEMLNHRASRTENAKLSNPVLWILFVLTALVTGIPVIILAIDTHFVEMSLLLFIVAIICCRFGYGFLRPAYDILVNNYIPKEYAQERATIMSVANMVRGLFAILFLMPSSGPSDKATAVGWLIPSGLLVGLTLVLHVCMRRYQKKIGEVSDASDLATDTGNH